MSDSHSSLFSGSPIHILVVRPDRIGDVILSTPVFEVLKRHYPHSVLTVMVRENVAPLVRGLPTVDDVMIFDPDGDHSGVSGFFRLMSEIRERGFRIAVVLHSHRKIAAALFGAGVRHRLGPLSKPHSFLFFNRGIRQHRSHVEMHEADYNLQLLRRLGIRVGSRNFSTRVHLGEVARSEARQYLDAHGFSESVPLVVVHPGMGGSAINWPEEHYIALIRALLDDEVNVLVTGGTQEGPLLGRIRDDLERKPPTSKRKAVFYGGCEVGALDRLVGLMSWSRLVVAPSTGPLHLAVALSRPVVTFFPPVRVQSAVRWGPYIQDESRAAVFVPEGYCGEDFSCRGNLCNYHPCMKSVTVPHVLEACRRLLAAPMEKHHG